MKHLRILVLAVMALSMNTFLLGATFTYTVRSDLQSDLDATFGGGTYSAIVNQLNNTLSQMKTEVESNIPADTQTNFLKQMAGAGAASTRGMGVDYASNPDIFTVGFGIGMGFGGFTGGISAPSNGLPSVGVGAGSSFILGLNAARVGIKDFWKIKSNRLTLYLNGMGYTMDQISNFYASTFSLGAHGQYEIVPQKAILPFKMLHWNGVDVSSGFDYTSMTAKITNNYTFTQTDGTLTTNWKVNGEVGAETGIFTIPIEASTGIQFLYVFTMYTGVGVDMNFGSSSSIANVGGPFSLTDPTNLPGKEIIGGDAKLDLSESQSPNFLDLRFFGGLQLNISALKIGTQVGWATGDNYNANFFIRAAW